MKVDISAGTEVTVRVDGLPSQEYQDQEDSRSSEAVAVSYIKVASGSHFTVHVKTDDHRLQNFDDAIRYAISLDGKKVTARTLRHFNDHGNAVGQSTGRESMVDGQKMLSKYQFGDLETTDEPSQALSIEDVRHLGEIEVSVCVVRMVASGRARPPPTPPSSALPTSSLGSISEKDLKGRAISHMATFGEPEAVQQPRGHAFARSQYEEPLSTTYPYGRQPFATFIFKYRSHRDLQIEDIIPRSPSPVSLENVKAENAAPIRNYDITEHDESAEPSPNAQIKQPKSDSSEVFGRARGPEAYVVSTQHSSSNRHQSLAGQSRAEPIDLTGDD